MERLPCDECKDEFVVNFAHIQCYRLSRHLIPTLSMHELAQFARLSRPLIPWAKLPVTRREYSTLPYYIVNRPPRTYLARFLTKMHRKLPEELQRVIYSYLDPSFLSLIACAAIIEDHHPKLPIEKLDLAGSVTYPLLSHTAPVRRLGVNLIDIIGETCVKEIGSGSGHWDHEIEVMDMPIRGLQVSLTSYGLAGLKILYADGSTSPWLGGASRKWFKTCEGSNLQEIETLFDVRYILTYPGSKQVLT